MTQSPSFIVDCSVTMSWCFEDESTPATQEILERLKTDSALVPSLWSLEVANVLIVAERRGRLSQIKAAQFIVALSALPIVMSDDESNPIEQLVTLARQHKLSAYDSAYLRLAIQTGLPLATLDVDLARASTASGVHVLP